MASFSVNSMDCFGDLLRGKLDPLNSQRKKETWPKFQDSYLIYTESERTYLEED